ncbi:MAG: hydrogenase maturation nickel metallochaperone HypA [Planctomycetaceae bacterium]|nr:hydrogenase maturation nickel metallochaperone HypA [Planctomycetaceae bacterium]
MHEESLIRTLLSQVEDIAALNNAVAVELIEVEVGPLSGVEPLLLQDAFERLKEGSAWPNAQLSVQQIGLDVLCKYCQRESQLRDFRFVCSHCDSAELQILRGDNCRLLNVKLQVNNSCV